MPQPWPTSRHTQTPRTLWTPLAAWKARMIAGLHLKRSCTSTPPSQSAPRRVERARQTVTFSPRMSWTPLSTSARERYPFPLGSNCRKSSSRSAFSESVFPIGSFAAHALQEHATRHQRPADASICKSARNMGPEVAVAASHGAASPLLRACSVASGSWCGHARGGLTRRMPGSIRARPKRAGAEGAGGRAWGGAQARYLAAATCCCSSSHRLACSFALAATGG